MNDVSASDNPVSGVLPQAEGSGGASTARPAAPAPHALIWIPGIDPPSETNDLASVSRRLAIALDRAATSAAARFRMAENIEEKELPGSIKVRKSTVLRRDGPDERPMIDLYEVDYTTTLLRPHLEANLFVRWWRVTWIALFGAWRAVRHLGIRAKSLNEKLQMLFVFLMLLLMASYAWLLAGAIVVTLDQQLEGRPIASTWSAATADLSAWGEALDRRVREVTGFDPPPTPQSEDRPTEATPPAAAPQITAGAGADKSKQDGAPAQQGFLLVLLAMLGLRSFSSVREFIEGAGARYSTAIEYLHAGIQRATLVGRLSQVLEHIEERELPYKDVAVMGYSFGTLVALDALFPHGRRPDLRFERVESLVTIGCPFDLTRAFWPAYALQRQAGEVAPRRWINVYSPLDVLGSNFRDDDTVGDSEWSVARSPAAGVGVGADIKPTNIAYRVGQAEEQTLGLVDVVTFLGIRSHKSYWSDIEEGERTCLHDVVSALYAGQDVLR